ncbi:MAG TPA: site-specific integrase [Casimicrobiaceae bacterium]|nr:site-specific integrase [Casimicrobiaceae bacterium]
MAAYQQLPNGHWRAFVGSGRNRQHKVFPAKREAKDWATAIEAQRRSATVSGFMAPPKDATLADLIEKHHELEGQPTGRTRRATHAMLKRELGHVRLRHLATTGAVELSKFIDQRITEHAGGVTIGADLSFLSAILKWGRYARRLDIPAHIALEARASLKHRNLNGKPLNTRSQERTREPTDDELAKLYKHWRRNPRQRINMPLLCDFADATGMRLDEICRIVVEDVDRENRTVIIRDRKDPRRKHGNDQVVPLLPRAWLLIEPLIRDRKEGKIFGVQSASVSTAFTRGCAELGIEDLHFHDIRHRATAQFFRMGLDIPRVALLTGHKTWTMLRRYTDIKPADVHAALAARERPTPAKKPPRRRRSA